MGDLSVTTAPGAPASPAAVAGPVTAYEPAKTMLTALLAETWKGILIMWSYKFNLLTSMISLTFVFLGINFFMGQGQLDTATMQSTLLGYLVWFYAITAIETMSWNLRDEMQCGQLEQLYMSPAPAQMLILGRSLSVFVVTTVQVVIISVVMLALFGISLPLTPAALPVFALTMAGLFGFGYALGGATLVFKQTGPLSNILTNALLFLSGAILAVSLLPPALEFGARLLPSTQGIDVLRRVVLQGESLADVWADGSLIWLIIHSVMFFAAGWLVYKWCEGIAKRKGSLGQY